MTARARGAIHCGNQWWPTMADEKQGGGGEENGEGMPIITGQDSIRITFSC